MSGLLYDWGSEAMGFTVASERGRLIRAQTQLLARPELGDFTGESANNAFAARISVIYEECIRLIIIE